MAETVVVSGAAEAEETVGASEEVEEVEIAVGEVRFLLCSHTMQNIARINPGTKRAVGSYKTRTEH